jgi:hypothetical protein
MRRQFFHRYLGVIVMCLFAIPALHALSISHFATSSKLASGKWVKITVPETGVYELTNEELSNMGFSDPAKVRIFGSGGYQISEILDGTSYDDLQPVPVVRYSDKICFYGKGTVKFTLTDPRYSTAHYVRNFNAYTSNGYYFLTDDIETPDTIAVGNEPTTSGTKGRASSLDYYYHEKDFSYYNNSGKEMLGEDFNGNSISLDYNLPMLCKDSTMFVNPRVAANVSTASYVSAILNTDTANFTLRTARISAPATSYVYYNTASPFTAIKPTTFAEKGKIQIGITTTGTINSAKLDYFIISYYHKNSFPAGTNQIRMGVNNLTAQDRIELPDVPDKAVVWDVTNEQNPVLYKTAIGTFNDTIAGDSIHPDSVVTHTVRNFTPGFDSRLAQYVVFNPDSTLLKIKDYQSVANQDLHSMKTPEMLIITDKSLRTQAERIAKLHEENDSMSVAVVNQDLIFNEFSSGGKDAMAYRLFAKMLYDREPAKLKYILLFGPGSFDNRGLLGNRDNMLLTYQSDVSNDETESYTTDDFFGMLDDASGSNLAGDMLTVGVGRIPSANYNEAVTDVDKLVNYVTKPDYGDWRNNVSLFADKGTEGVGDYGLYIFQSERSINLLNTKLNTCFATNKVYVSQYPRANEVGVQEDYRTASEAKKKLKELLSTGQYFATYTGHADPTTFTKTSHMWTTSDVQSTTYKHLPIMTTAACDVARYDSDSRGIAEYMFHQKDGGAIALLTSSRSVYANSNDVLSKAFIRNFFSYDSIGKMPTLGYAYKMSKRYFGTEENTNKMSFCLLGDPAIKINYPLPRFKITEINGDSIKTDSTETSTGPLTKLTVSASVMKADGKSVDTSFNGDATLSLYDAAAFFMRTSQYETDVNSRTYITLDINYPNELIGKITGRVKNGRFTCSIIVPKYCKAQDEKGLIRVYAHKDSSTEMVNGVYKNLTIKSYNDSTAIKDTIPPVISDMYFNDAESFTEGALVPSSSTLYINASDNVALNTQAVSIGNGMSLFLDGNSATYPDVKDYTTVTEDGKSLAISFPMSGLKDGRHTLKYQVSDVAGNISTRTISFLVGSSTEVSTLSVAEDPVVSKATFDLTTSLSGTATVTLNILDAAGNTVYKTDVTSFPYTWNLKDNNGVKVPAGIYRFYGTVVAGNNYGGTPIGQIIVVEPNKKK